jgi:methylated-DNA-[protein]-cysteine S-methyltransferase
MSVAGRARYESPLGTLTLTAGEAGLSAVLFAHEELSPAPTDPQPAPLAEALRQLDEYFAGARVAFDVPLDPAAGTDFQRAVWRVVGRIPYGTPISYGELARRTGRPGHVRAAGGANARNPLPIVVACHRVVGARGDLTGYSGGLARKRALLALEAAHRDAAVARLR